MIPDGERIVSDYLRAELDERVVTKPPSDRDGRWIMVTQIDASADPRDTGDHAITFYLQMDCYAGKDGGTPEAKLLARRVREALAEVAKLSLPEAVVSGARIRGHQRLTDTDMEPARDRVLLTADVYVHGAEDAEADLGGIVGG